LKILNKKRGKNKRMDRKAPSYVERQELISELVSLTKHSHQAILTRLYDDVKRKCKSNQFVLRDFQLALKDVSLWSDARKREEVERFDIANIKIVLNHILLLNQELFHQRSDAAINASDFVYANILNVAREVWTKPFLLYHRVNKSEYQKNMMALEKLVVGEIKSTVRKIDTMTFKKTQTHNVPIVTIQEKGKPDVVINNVPDVVINDEIPQEVVDEKRVSIQHQEPDAPKEEIIIIKTTDEPKIIKIDTTQQEAVVQEEELVYESDADSASSVSSKASSVSSKASIASSEPPPRPKKRVSRSRPRISKYDDYLNPYLYTPQKKLVDHLARKKLKN
jgi:hypothetical protein